MFEDLTLLVSFSSFKDQFPSFDGFHSPTRPPDSCCLQWGLGRAWSILHHIFRTCENIIHTFLSANKPACTGPSQDLTQQQSTKDQGGVFPALFHSDKVANDGF